jgi:gliding motility-associated-like protein
MKYYQLLIFFFIYTISFSQENCNNGIDDDGDGKIDLNDPDCACGTSSITSIIPNPSFESYTSCPSGFSELNVASPWIQATQATTDYYNNDCSFIAGAIVDNNLNSYPAGKGIVAALYLRDWNEYLGTTLLSTMTAGTAYQLSFNVAAVTIKNDGSSTTTPITNFEPVNITLYGCTNGTNLPLSTVFSPNINDPTWQIIGQATYTPISSWGVVNMIFTPAIDVNAIMIGAPPVLPVSYPSNSSADFPYFLYDNLLLNTASSFGVNITSTGNFCENDLVLTANITATVGTGTTYQWYKNGIAIVGATSSSYSVPAIPTNLGEYSVKITNGSTCYVSTKFLINNTIPGPSFTTIQPNCITPTGTINITTPAAQYSFDNGLTWQNSPTKSLLAVGIYNVKIKSPNGCISSATGVSLSEPDLLNFSNVTVIQPTTCDGTGSITVNSSIAAQYSYDDGITWTTNSTATNLQPGTYLVKIKDANGCQSASQFVIINRIYLSDPVISITQPTCGNGGTISVNTNANLYSFDDGVTWVSNAVASNLPAGAYLIKIKQANGCESNSVYAYLEPFYVNITPVIDIIQPTCGNGGSITVATTSAQYSFDGGVTWTTSNSATNLVPGYYEVILKNSAGCINQSTWAYLEQFYLPEPNFTTIQPVCGTGGTITVTTPSAQYSFDGGLTWTTNNSLANQPPGYYAITIKNSLGCISNTVYAILNDFFLPDPNYVAVNPYCGNIGSITITTPAAQYSFDGGVTWTTNNVATNLSDGYYYIKVKNSLGCESNYVFVYLDSNSLANPNITVVQPGCNSNGSITINTSAAQYSFDGGTTWITNPTANNLAPGNYYYVMIKNSAGCVSYAQGVYMQPFYLPYPLFTVAQPTCGNNGSITITTPAAEYSFDGGSTWTTNPVASNLTSNFYNILIKNSLGCVSNSQYVYIEPFYLPVPLLTITQPICGTNGIISVTTAAAEYSFDNGNTWTTNPTASNLTPGYYNVVIKNNLGCESYSQGVYIEPYYLPNPNFTLLEPTCSSNGSITITTTAAEYSFDGGTTWTTNNVANNLTYGYYTILIKNGLGCVSSPQYVYLPQVYLPLPTYAIVQPSCTSSGSITITTTANEYSFDNGTTWTTNPILNNLTSSYYFIMIRNNVNCYSYSTFVNVNSVPNIPSAPQVTSVNPINCGSSNGSITVTTSALSYSFDNGVTWSNSSTLNSLSAGTYLVKIKTSNSGCESPATTVILNTINGTLNPPNFTIIQPTCSLPTGTINITTSSSLYSFDNGATFVSSNTKTNLAPGTYQLKIKDAAGCISTASSATIVNLINISAPSVTVTQPDCSSSTGSILVNTTASLYSFDNGVTFTSSNTQNGLATGNYLIKIKDATGCLSDASSVTINNQPTTPNSPTISIVHPINCTTSTGTITVTSSASLYSFDNGITWSNNNSSIPLNSGTYQVLIKETPTGCPSAATTAIINSPPNAPATPTVVITQPASCANPFGSISITSSAFEYSFDNGLTYSNNPNSLPLAVGTYEIKVKNSSNCESSSVTALINAPSDYPIAPLFTIVQPDCNNSNGSISIVTSATEYSFDNGVTWTTNPNLANLPPATYKLRIKNALGCLSPFSNAIIVAFTNFPNSPILTSPQTFCIQQNATLNDVIISGSNIKWYNTSTAGNLLTSSTILVDGTTYFASQTIGGCESSRVPVLVNIQNTPTPTGAGLQTFCSTQNPTLNDITINGTNVIWYNSNTSTIPLAGTTNLTDGGIYYASQTINGCESINRVPITVSLINTLNANNYSEVICDNLNDGNEILDLATYNALLISNTSNCTFEYYNSFSGATNQSTINLITPTNNYNLIIGNHIIYVRIISNNGCHQIVELSLTLVNKPIILIPDITPICTGNNITISAGLGFDTYSWSTGESSQSIVVNQEGNYSVTVTKNNFGTICSTTKNFEVVLSNIAIISNIETIDWTDNENIITVNIDSNSLGDYEYSLDGIHYQDSNVFNGLFSGQYSVYVRDKNGCGIVKKDIYLFSYPKYFTPNADGINDIWKINFSEKEPTIIIKIFDRFSKLLKNTSDNGWDGTYNGQLMPSDDYWFVITRANGKEYRGHFALKR